jgi:hypothetical protein
MSESRPPTVATYETEYKRLEKTLACQFSRWPGDQCPLCGALIGLTAQQKHREWHLRNLQ